MAEQERNERTSALTPRFEPLGALRPWWPWGRGFGTRVERLMDRLFDEMIDERRRAPALVVPAIDLRESDTHYTLTAELPGVDKGDVTVELADGTLTIRGEKKSEREEKTGRRRYVERSTGQFSRSLPLPSDAQADPAQIDASFKDGVLTVKIPRSEEAKPAVIAIK